MYCIIFEPFEVPANPSKQTQRCPFGVFTQFPCTQGFGLQPVEGTSVTTTDTSDDDDNIHPLTPYPWPV